MVAFFTTGSRTRSDPVSVLDLLIVPLPQPGGQAGLTGQACRFVHDHKGRILIEDHSLPSSSRAFSLSTPATVLPSLISPLMTIS